MRMGSSGCVRGFSGRPIPKRSESNDGRIGGRWEDPGTIVWTFVFS